MAQTTYEIWKNAGGTVVSATDPTRVTLVAPWGWEVAPSVIPAASWPAAPTLTAISPAVGKANGPPIIVVLTGTNFTNKAQVLVNNVAVPVTWISATTMEAVVNLRSQAAATLVVKVQDDFAQTTAGQNLVIS